MKSLIFFLCIFLLSPTAFAAATVQDLQHQWAIANYQTSEDVTENDISYGALSKTLYHIIEKQKKQITWKGLWLKLLVKMRKDKYSQVPQISVSNTKLFKSFVNL